MKVLTLKEIEQAPSLVQYIYAAWLCNTPIGMATLDEAVKAHPEYFPDEVEHRRKWSLVPKSVQDEYFSELWKLHEEVYNDLPHENKGILYYAQHPKEYREWQEALDKRRPMEAQREKELHEKYLAPYGIPYNKD